MKNLPTPVKILIILLTFAGMFVTLRLLNMRVQQVEMPAPDTTMGIVTQQQQN